MAVTIVDEAERKRRLEMEVCPFNLGQKVRVKKSHEPWSADWYGEEFVVTGLSWNYRSGDGSRINVSIAGEEDIVNRNGDTDGFDIDHLEAV